MNYGAASEDVLLPLAREGDQKAFGALLEANYPRLFGLSIRMCGDEQLAKDAVQDASLAAWRHLPGFRGGSTFGTWIYRITLNATLRRMRKRREQPVGDSLELIAGLSTVEGPGVTKSEWPVRADDALERQQIRRSVMRALETLPPKYSEIFRLRDVRGMSLREISEATGLSIPAVKTRVHRARKRMRVALGGRV
ncbi:MAG: RNA polymerase sigma factor [Deltaproteobacteria bacterium]|nr:RNA polymerase sigma factor [Deltaproteobacteria bacterium]